MSPTWLPKSQVLHRATEGCLEVQMPSPQPRSRRWRGAPRARHRGRRRGRRRRASPAAALGQRTWRTWLAPSPRRAGGRLGQWLSAPSKNIVKSFTEKKFWSSVNLFNKCSFYQIVSFHFTNSIFYIHQSFMLLHPVCLMRSRDLPVQAFRTSSHTNAKKPAISVNSTERDSWKKMPEIKIMFTLYTVFSCTQLVSVLDASMPESSIQIHTQQ